MAEEERLQQPALASGRSTSRVAAGDGCPPPLASMLATHAVQLSSQDSADVDYRSVEQPESAPCREVSI